jgi:hypothetical protein
VVALMACGSGEEGAAWAWATAGPIALATSSAASHLPALSARRLDGRGESVIVVLLESDDAPCATGAGHRRVALPVGLLSANGPQRR